MLSASLNDTPLYLLAGTFRQFRTFVGIPFAPDRDEKQIGRVRRCGLK